MNASGTSTPNRPQTPPTRALFPTSGLSNTSHHPKRNSTAVSAIESARKRTSTRLHW
ncbi:hypothetical protein P154DRAFT_521097 [Amniculicola lignicola CBS 123094]|uniref:Uncharacterized protein n=1 Tax=Amniculicola lignicola CBS 123094 TaxID=1392246 RepID=A0A6A5WQ06_9PLEO|nr:hypothetical protein P154DRAFT_521097 [Amniculicola lignicola CBS 123094]